MPIGKAAPTASPPTSLGAPIPEVAAMGTPNVGSLKDSDVHRALSGILEFIRSDSDAVPNIQVSEGEGGSEHASLLRRVYDQISALKSVRDGRAAKP